MKIELEMNEVKFILESLKYSKMKFENYDYPSFEMKKEKIEEVEIIIEKLKRQLLN